MATDRMYPNVDFPPYKFQEFPKWVDGPEGKVLVNNQKEELDAAAGKSPPPPDPIAAELTVALNVKHREVEEANQRAAALEKELAELKMRTHAAATNSEFVTVPRPSEQLGPQPSAGTMTPAVVPTPPVEDALPPEEQAVTPVPAGKGLPIATSLDDLKPSKR